MYILKIMTKKKKKKVGGRPFQLFQRKYNQVFFGIWTQDGRELHVRKWHGIKTLAAKSKRFNYSSAPHMHVCLSTQRQVHSSSLGTRRGWTTSCLKGKCKSQSGNLTLCNYTEFSKLVSAAEGRCSPHRIVICESEINYKTHINQCLTW